MRSIFIGEEPLAGRGCLLYCLFSAIGELQGQLGAISPVADGDPDSIGVGGSVGDTAGQSGEHSVISWLLVLVNW